MSKEPMAESDDHALKQLVLTRRVASDFASSSGLIRVETRIRISRPPWAMRTAVLRDGVELQRGPFTPFDEQLSEDIAAYLESLDRFAARALERHKDICRQVQEDIRLGGAGLLDRNLGVREDWTPYAVVAIALVVMTAIMGAGSFLKPTPFQEDFIVHMPIVEPRVNINQPPIEIQATPEQAVDSGPAPLEYPVDHGQQTVQVQPEVSQEEQKNEESPSTESSKPESTPVAEPAAPQRSVISDIEPSYYGGGLLSVGKIAYVDSNVKIADVPKGYEGLRCIRTANEDRLQERGMSFELREGSRIYVLHDRRIRKKPSWLSEFTATGESVVIAGPSGKGPVYLDVYIMNWAAGGVRLGPNLEWTELTRELRNFVTKELNMYIVCVGPY